MTCVILKLRITDDVSPEEEVILNVPVHAQPISLQIQKGVGICLWFAVPLDESREEYAPVRFKIVGTGRPFEWGEGWLFLGTVQSPPEVWHVFKQG